MRLRLSISLLLLSLLVAGALAADAEIRFEKFVLDNGLTLIVHEDHRP
jgi:hypothetical protein